MDEDVKTQDSVEQPVAAPTEQPSQVAETPETPNVPEISQQPERQIPLKELIAERKKRQDLQRELAQLKTGSQMSQYDPNDLEQVMQHPLVQELMLKDAKRELTDYARDTLDQYPTIPEQVKKAILKNVRGFVSEQTSDVETAKIDILEYIEALAAESGTIPTQKGFPVAANNVPQTETSNTSLAEVQKILNKPVDEMTEEDVKQVKEAQKRLKK